MGSVNRDLHMGSVNRDLHMGSVNKGPANGISE